MKLTTLISVHAVISLASGIAFGLYAPLMLAFFAIPQALDNDVLIYWQVTAFARMFGAALFGFGLLLWALRGLLDQLSPKGRRGFIFALLLANLMAFIVALTQQFAVWQSIAGWVQTGLFALLVLAYGYFLVQESRTG